MRAIVKIGRPQFAMILIAFFCLAAGASAKSSDEALKLLKEGNARFVGMKM